MSTSPRLERLRQAARERDLDAVVVSSWENRLYFSGFEGSSGYLLVSPSEAVLGTDFRYVEQAGRQAPGFRVDRLARVRLERPRELLGRLVEGGG